MLRGALIGAAAGAVGTVTLDIVTYADMLLRARPSSGVPAKTAAALAARAGIDLGGEGPEPEDQAKGEQRRSGLGALMGYAVGLGIGSAYGLLRPLTRGVPLPLAGAVLGLVAMAASDVPSVAAGATDPQDWGLSGWAADIIPHLAYGWLTALAYDALGA